MNKTEKIFIFWMVFGTLFLGFLIMCSNANYLEENTERIISNIYRWFIAIGFTFITLLIISLSVRSYFK
jgi:hypothetical protein